MRVVRISLQSTFQAILRAMPYIDVRGVKTPADHAQRCATTPMHSGQVAVCTVRGIQIHPVLPHCRIRQSATQTSFECTCAWCALARGACDFAAAQKSPWKTEEVHIFLAERPRASITLLIVRARLCCTVICIPLLLRLPLSSPFG